MSLFRGIQHSADGHSATSCNFGILTGEDEHMSFYSTILKIQYRKLWMCRHLSSFTGDQELFNFNFQLLFSLCFTSSFLSFLLFFFQLYQNTLHTNCGPHIMLYTNKAKINRKCMHAQSCLILGDPTDCSHQASPSMGIPRQEYWNRLPFPTPRNLPNPGIKIVLPASASLAGRFFTTSTIWEDLNVKILTLKEFTDKTMKQRVEREFKKA